MSSTSMPSTAASLRIIDTSVRGARENLAMTAALAELHGAGRTPDTLRFQHFHPAAIIGRHQVLADEVHLDHARANGIETARRRTGGGAIYMGPGMLGFELIVARALLPGALETITARLCTALAGGLATFGVDARFRPRNDVEVDGRKVSGTGGYVEGGTLVFQGTVLVEFDVAAMAAVLVLPAAKRDRRSIAALADRVTSLRALLGAPPPMRDVEIAVAAAFAAALGLVPQWCDTAAAGEEQTAAALLAAEIGRDDYVAGDGAELSSRHAHASLQAAGGTVSAAARLRQGRARVIDRIWITGDFFATPARVIPDLEAALAGLPLGEAPAAAAAFLVRANADILGVTPSDIAGLVARLADEPAVKRSAAEAP